MSHASDPSFVYSSDWPSQGSTARCKSFPRRLGCAGISPSLPEVLSSPSRRWGEARPLSSLQLMNLTSNAPSPWWVRTSLQLGASEPNDRNLYLCFCKIKSAFPMLQSVGDPEKAAQALKHYRNLSYTIILSLGCKMRLERQSQKSFIF